MTNQVEFTASQSKKFVARVKKIRADRGLTQGMLGKKLGMTRQNVWNVENGKQSISPRFVTAVNALEKWYKHQDRLDSMTVEGE